MYTYLSLHNQTVFSWFYSGDIQNILNVLFFFPNVSVPIVSLAVLAANTYFSAVHAGYIDGSRLLDHEGLAIGCKVSVLQLVTPNVVPDNISKSVFSLFRVAVFYRSSKTVESAPELMPMCHLRFPLRAHG